VRKTVLKEPSQSDQAWDVLQELSMAYYGELNQLVIAVQKETAVEDLTI
jgi:hypothetical protein